MDGNCHRNVWNHLRREGWVSQKAHGYSFNLYPHARGNVVMLCIAVPSNIYSILTYFQWKGTGGVPITGRIWCAGHIEKNIWKWTMWNPREIETCKVTLKIHLDNCIRCGPGRVNVFNDTELAKVVYAIRKENKHKTMNPERHTSG